MTGENVLVTGDKITLMLSLIPFLLENGPTPIPDLASHFRVEAKTIRTIVRFFGTAGIPGATATYQDEDLFDIDWDALEERDEAALIRTVVVHDAPRFSPREVAALLAGLQLIQSIPSIAKPDEISALIQKLASSGVRPPARIEIQHHLVPEALTTVNEALSSGRSIRFTYRDSEGVISARHVQPRSLESVDDIWYLRGWCSTRAAERLFRIDRMHELSSQPAVTEAPEGSHAAFDATQTSLYSPSADATQVRVRMLDDRTAPLREFDPTYEAGIASVLLAHPLRAPRVVAAAPGSVEVVGPAAARSAVRDWAARALAQYQS